MKKNFYITSPIFYPNAILHMGHAYVMTIVDIMARYHRLIEDDTYFLAGSDENTSKVIKAAAENGKTIEEHLDHISESFISLYKDLNISYDQFIRTSDKEIHWPGAQLLWNKLVEAGDIELRFYTGLYCVSCETFYTEKDLIDGKCPIHETVPEKIEEENYFFKLSKYTNQIREKIKSNEFRVIPDSRRNEILALLDRGLEDVSFSRPAKTIPWGIPVPNDPTQNIYVWCDALSNYITALGYGRKNNDNFKKFWPADFHVIGKDILRFHAAIWPGMLMSAKLPLPKALLVHGLITSSGRKMSKSLGNVIDPKDLLQEYGTDALRYYFAREVSPFEDGDLTNERFKEVYNANLANGIGNLTSRLMKMAAVNLSEPIVPPEEGIKQEFKDALENFQFNKAADMIWAEISAIDAEIQKTEPFKLIKTDKEKAIRIIKELLARLFVVGKMLHPIMPETSEKIREIIKSNKMPEAPLFARKD